MIARVRGVIFAGDVLGVDVAASRGSMSANTGVAPRRAIDSAVA